MDIEQAKTFLAIAAHGSFLEAARHLHLTQSTISARIQKLEEELKARLFIRNRAGATLTTAGQRFMAHAKTLVLTVEQARHDVGLAEHYNANLRIGGRIALWDELLPRWVGWIRQTLPQVSIHSEIGFEEDLMRRLVESTLDIGVMYTPTHTPELVVEHLFDENLVMVSTDPDTRWPDRHYIYIDWGPGFFARHHQAFPDFSHPPQTANIGWLGVQLMLQNGGACYLPQRIADPLIGSGRLQPVAQAPSFRHPAYAVYPRRTDSEAIGTALRGLRDICAGETDRSDDPGG